MSVRKRRRGKDREKKLSEKYHCEKEKEGKMRVRKRKGEII